MVVTRSESISNGWEKAIAGLEKKADSTNDMLNKLNIQLLTTNEKVSTLSSQLEGKFRRLFWQSSAGRIEYGWHPSMTIPTFDVPDTIAWLTWAGQYFMVSNIPMENRVGIAMMALARPALPWFQLLHHRMPDLS